MKMGTEFDRAITVAEQYHIGQRRKNTGLPYIVHLVDVVRNCQNFLHLAGLTRFELLNDVNSAEFIFQDKICATAMLHDVLEDANTSEAGLRIIFSDDVVDDVVSLTNEKDINKNRTTRKEEMCNRLSRASLVARFVKICDRLANLRDMVKEIDLYDGSGFIYKYAEESQKLLDSIIPDQDILQYAEKQYSSGKCVLADRLVMAMYMAAGNLQAVINNLEDRCND